MQTKDHVKIKISSADHSLLSSIKEKMETAASPICIFKVPDELLKINENAYMPSKVSIGPFHHGKQALKSMEDHKWRYLHSLLNRKPNLEANLGILINALKEAEDRARKFFSEDINFITSDNFVQILLLDGCFIIEIFLKYSFKSLRRQYDPIFSTPGMLFEIRCDMTLLENQIPLFVLQMLFQLVQIPSQFSQFSFSELAFRFFKNMVPGSDQQLTNNKFTIEEAYHLLDLIHHFVCISPTYNPRVEAKDRTVTESWQSSEFSACNLQKMGIRLKKVRTGKSLLDMKFVNGVLKIPPLKLHQCSETLFCNLIAFEQGTRFDNNFTVENSELVKSYAFFMGCLVRSKDDVKLLRRHKIIMITNEGNDVEKEVVQLFKKMCEGVKNDMSCYSGIFEQVKEYLKKRRSCSAKRQKLKHMCKGTPVWLTSFLCSL